jgi:hypothetical protein
MSVSLDRGTTIGRLRLRAATADPHALRMRGSTAVGALDLQPPAMPEQAILCIRALRDPLPGGLDLRFSAAPRPIAWETAMRGAVAGALRRAARPALGPVPAEADAVLFADRSELLACAARDALGGALTIHWWWTHLLGGGRSPAAVAREWARSPAYVPSAVEQLAARNEITGLARILAPAEAVHLLETVLRVHALPALASSVVQALTATPEPPPSPTRTGLQGAGDPEIRPRLEPLVSPPWRTAVPDLPPAALTIEQHTLVAITLTLRRAPALVRSEPFAKEAVAWIESEHRRSLSIGPIRPIDSIGPIRPIRPIGPITTDRTDPLRLAALQEDSGESNAAPEAEPPSAEPRRPVPQRLETRGPEELRPDPQPETASRETQPAPSSIASVLEEPPAPDAAQGPEIIERAADPEAGEPPRPDLAIDTEFAGVFFLLNVGIALGLYSDFTSPVQCGIDLDVWDFLALTGPALAEIDGFGEDPIGPFLAALANRKEGEEPGAGFLPPDGRSLRQWLDSTVLRIRERLALAGLEDPARIVRRYGRVTTTPAHLDVYLSLAAHPIEIRLAGLDRNPGWIPAAGRHVAFHFD